MIFLKKTTSCLFLGVLLLNILGLCFFKNKLDFPTDTRVFYSPVAENLVAGKGYAFKGSFSDRYPPGYPLFLAVIYGLTRHPGETNPVYPFATACLQALSCVFIFKIARFLNGSKNAAASAILLCSYPFFLVLSATRYSWTAMPLFMVIFFAGIYLFLKNFRKEISGKYFPGFFLSGLLLGLSCLVWPAPVYIWILFAVYLLTEQAQHRKAVLSFIPGFFLPIILWSALVWTHTGSFHISGGQMLSMRDGLVHTSGGKMGQFDFGRQAAEDMKAGKIKSLKDIAVFTGKKMRSDFKDTAAYLTFKLFRPWYATDSEKFENVILAVQFPYILLATIGVSRLLKERKKETLLLIGVIVYFWLTAFSVLSILRYMTASMGLMMIFIPAGAEFIWKGIFKR